MTTRRRRLLLIGLFAMAAASPGAASHRRRVPRRSHAGCQKTARFSVSGCSVGSHKARWRRLLTPVKQHQVNPGSSAMSQMRSQLLFILLALDLLGCQRAAPVNLQEAEPASSTFTGSKAGEEREVARVKLCWCPAGKFTMGSPPDEPERRTGEDQVEVTLTKGFLAGKFEVSQGQWN